MTPQILPHTQTEAIHQINDIQSSVLTIFCSSNANPMAPGVFPEKESWCSTEKQEKERYSSLIVQSMLEFSEIEQVILALYFYERLTLSDIAHLMKLDKSDVSNILARMLGKIRSRLSSSKN